MLRVMCAVNSVQVKAAVGPALFGLPSAKSIKVISRKAPVECTFACPVTDHGHKLQVWLRLFARWQSHISVMIAKHWTGVHVNGPDAC